MFAVERDQDVDTWVTTISNNVLANRIEGSHKKIRQTIQAGPKKNK